MVRTLQTTRVNTTRVPPPQAPFYPVVVEEVPVEQHHLFVRNGVIMEDSSEEILATPTPSPAPHALPAGASSSALPVPVAQAPAPAGDDPDDSGDDGGNDDDEEDNQDNNNNNNDDDDDNNNNNGHDDVLEPITEHYTSMFETGYFPNLLQSVLYELGIYVRPLYDTRRVSEPPRAPYYISRLHIRVMDEGDRGFRTLSAHQSMTPLSTYAASISDVSRRALWSLSHTYRLQLQDTMYRHLSLRPCGESQTNIVPRGAGEDRLNTLVGVVAGLNSDLDSATLDLSRIHEELEDAHARIAALEAQLEGRGPPEAEVPITVVSPPRKRLRYGAPGSITRLL